MDGGRSPGVESESPRRLSVVSGTRELSVVVPRNGNLERYSHDHHEGIHLFTLGQRLQQGVNSGRRTFASGAIDEFGLVDCLGHDGY